VADVAASLVADLAVYRRLVGARIRADWQYRTSFAFYLLGQILASTADLGAIALVFANVDALAGWSGPEVVFLFAASGLSFGIGDVLVSQVENASIHIKAGTFDRFLIRPIGALWQLCASEFALRRIGRVVQPLVALGVVLAIVDVEWTAPRVLLVPLTVACGSVIFSAIWVVTSSIAFWTVETQELANSFTYGGNQLTGYPVDVLARWLRRIAVFVVPLASVAYLPGCALFDKPMPFDLPRWVAWTGPAVALVMALLARSVWREAIRHYRSTGS
jgi:ABC-2 type transport system permease protein